MGLFLCSLKNSSVTAEGKPAKTPISFVSNKSRIVTVSGEIRPFLAAQLQMLFKISHGNLGVLPLKPLGMYSSRCRSDNNWFTAHARSRGASSFSLIAYAISWSISKLISIDIKLLIFAVLFPVPGGFNNAG